ncbi:MAG: acetyl-CoA acetyltransferase [Pseudonocardia sp.]|nr:acetyl-CoA acetyltransferase [Pseudonocardia sp.]
MSEAHLDPRTPVVVGVGQASERIDDPGYRALSPVELAALAVREALNDCGADVRQVAAAVDTIAGVRQFEISHPYTTAPLGRSDNFPRSVARRIGATPSQAILEVAGGQAPQHLVTELASRIADGEAEVAVAVGAEALSTAARLRDAEDRPDWSENVGGQLEDRGHGMDGIISAYHITHGLTSAMAAYALFENARRARLGLSRRQYAAAEIGELFAPFTQVAATNRHAAVPVARSAAELITPTERNRFVADPYTRYVVAKEKVNQAAAVLLMSVAAARRFGVPPARRVFLHGHADLRERDMLERADLGAAPASVLAVRHALEIANVSIGDLATIDLYSCFPITVSVIRDGLGLPVDDPRGLTVTGGLPFFGGPGNNYAMHAIAETVARARAAPGSFGLVGANGGFFSKYSVGIYSTTPTAWRASSDAKSQAEVDAWAAHPQAVEADGWATIETFTVTHRKDGARTGIVVGHLDNGRRFLARTFPGDSQMLDALGTDQPTGGRVYVRSSGAGNRVTMTETDMHQRHHE